MTLRNENSMHEEIKVTLNSATVCYRFVHKILPAIVPPMGRDSSDGIATGYVLDGPRIESRWGARLFTHVQTGPGAHPTSCTMGMGFFPGVKRPGRGADHPPPSSAEVKKD
jgi:hypothetical protein